MDLPSAAFLRVSPALVTEQIVRRARVSFRVIVETEDDSVEVFDEVFRFGDAKPVVSKNTNELKTSAASYLSPERKVRSRERLGGLLRF